MRSPCCRTPSGQFVPGHPGRFVTPTARHLVRASLNALAMPAARTYCVRERENSAEPFDDPWLAAHDGPPLRWMIANFKKPPVDRHVMPIHIEHDDIARRNA